MEPACWALLNPRTLRIDATKCYVREEVARAAAIRRSGRWASFVAVPLFLHPEFYREDAA